MLFSLNLDDAALHAIVVFTQKNFFIRKKCLLTILKKKEI